MKFPPDLGPPELAALPAYEWDTVLFNTFWSVNDEDNPRLAAALQLISVKAAFALGVACCEWVIARVDGRTDVGDARLRTQAGWAAAVDPRYAEFPPVPPTPPSQPQPFASPLRLAMKILALAHDRFEGDGEYVYAGAQGLTMLVDHITGQHPVFAEWLADALRRCHARYPAKDEDIDDQKPVPQEFFEPGFAWSEAAAQTAVEGFVRTLDPAANPYLRSPADMLADGFAGRPYGRP